MSTRTISFDGRTIQVPGDFSDDDVSKVLATPPVQTPSPASTLQQSMAYGSAQDPEQYAKLLQLKKQTGLGPEVTKDRQPQIQQSIDVNSIDYPQFAVSHPRTTAWASNPENAAVSGVSEVQRLAGIEANAGEMRAATSWESFQANTIQPKFRAAMEYPLTRMAIDAVAGTSGMVGNIGSRLGVHGDGATNQNLLQRIDAALNPSQTGAYVNGAPDKDNGMDWLAKNVAPMIPAVMATGGVSLLAKTLGLPITAAKALAGLSVGGMFTADQSGKTYTAAKASGASDNEALRAENQVAAINFIPNALFGAMDVVPFMRDNPLVTALGLGGATGAAGQVSQNVVTDKPALQGTLSAALQGMAMQGGMHLGTQAFFGNLAAASDAAAESKLRERSPEKFHEGLQQIFEGDPSLRIPSEQFNGYFKGKSMDPAAVAKGLGSTNYTEAVMSGGDVEVPTEGFLGKLDPEHQKGLLADIVDPSSGLTLNQHKQGIEELQQFATGGGAEKLIQDTAAAYAENAASPEHTQVKEELRQRYVNAGETPEVAETLATKDANVYSNLARNAGMKPTELLDLYNPKVTVGEAGEGVLYQSGTPIDGHEGKDTTLLTPSREIPAKYRLVEADDLQPSHNAQTFAKNPSYPEGIQERAYDTSKEAQGRVIQQAQNYDPRYTVNTNPDAVNGPPIVTPEGVVLGGNSRAMSTQRLYAKDGSAYKDSLKEQAAAYGFTPEQVEGMKKPVLVRQVESPATPDEARRLGSELNKSMTGAMGVSERAVSAGKDIKPETLRNVANMMQADDSTLREAMGKHGSEIVKMLTTDGVFTDRERPQFVDTKTGGLSEEGKTFVERALMGSVIDDPRLMDAAPKSVLLKLERSLGSITSFASRPDEWNIIPALRDAVAELGAIQRSGSTVELRLGQTDLFGAERNPLVDAMIRALDGKPNAVRDAFDSFAHDADANMPGQARMFGEANAFDAFNHAFGSKLTESEYHNGLEEAAGKAPDIPAATDAQGDEGVSGSSDSDAARSSESSESAASPSQVTPASPRGWFRVLPDGSYEIGRTKIGDLSTFVHEPAHAYLKIIGDLAKRDGASETFKEDYGKILDFLGAKDAESLTVDQQEKWARANEQYIREGKAPSPTLRGLFQRFSIWLGSIYKKASDLGVELSPDIRAVFDRLYAAEDGVNKAEREAGPQVFNSAEEAGWTPEQFKSYADEKGMGVEQAKAEILAKLNEPALRDKTEAWRNEEDNVRGAVTAELDRRPEYAAIRALRKGELDDGTPLTMSGTALKEQFGEERVKALQQQHRGLYRNEGGVDPETAAEMLGFTSAHEMMKALESAPRRSAAVEQETRAYMTNKHGDIRYDGTLDDQARLALENDQKSDSIYRELKALKQKVADLQGRKEAMRSIEIAPLASYREAARQMVESKSAANLQPSRYLDASRKYSREAFDAARNGDAEAAGTAKHKELLNHFLYREAMKAQKYIGKFKSFVKWMRTPGRQGKLGLAGGDYRDQFNYLMGRYNIGRRAGAAPYRTLAEWAQDEYARDKMPAIDPAILDGTDSKNYRTVPIAEVRKVHDALINIKALAAQELGMTVNGRRIEFDKATAEMDARAREKNKVTPTRVFRDNAPASEKATGFVQRGNALLMRTEFLMQRLDGGMEGPWHDNLWNVAADSQGREDALNEQVTKVLGEAMENMPKEQRMKRMEKVQVPGITDIPGKPETIVRRDLVSMAFNMGNDGNLDRMTKSFDERGWDSAVIDRIKNGMLTRNEWKFIQDGWNALVPLGAEQAAVEQRGTGLPPEMVKPTPLAVKCSDGSEMQLTGGYYPIDMDPRFSTRGAMQGADGTAGNLMEAGYGRATLSRDSMKQRTGFGGPLEYNYEKTLTQHVAQVVKDITHREFMLSSNKLLLNQGIRTALRETLGEGYEEKMMPWLRSTINDRNGSTAQGLNDLSKPLAMLRTNLVKAALGFKVSTILLQVSHASSMFNYTSAGSYSQALIDFMAHPMEMSEEIRNLSPNEMKFRGMNIDRDVRAAIQTKTGQKSTLDTMGLAGLKPLQLMDHLMSFPLWLSVYRDALTERVALPEDEAHYQAMHVADGAVRMGLGSHAPKDLPPIMRNNDFTKMITMFGGFGNLKWNQVSNEVHDYRNGGSGGALTYGLLMAAMIPFALGNFVTGHGPMDGENPGLWAAKRAVLGTFEHIPVFGNVLEAWERGGDASFSPIFAMLERAAKVGARANSDKENKDWTGIGLDTLQTAMEALGVPGTDQAAKSIRYARQAGQGKVENPNAWDALVGSAHK
jgi:ddrB-like ParB superfamily domain/Large polyvalent protein associated domain 22